MAGLAPTALIVDDDDDIRLLVKELLSRAGVRGVPAANGRDALRTLYATAPDMVILDVQMPQLDGWDTLGRIRELSDLPVLMLSARGLELEKVRALQLGADDYVVKPFGRQELVARVQALLRRASGAGLAPDVYDDGVVQLDHAQRLARAHGRELRLTPREFQLLAAFVRNAGRVLSHEQLLALVWGSEWAVSPDQVRLYVRYLRTKLDAAGAATSLETVRGFGYRYVPGSLTQA